MRNWIFWAALSGFLAVALGAFGAHALEGVLGERQREVYRTAALYHLVHSAVLAVVGSLARSGAPSRALSGSGALFLAGMLLFSGSLYLLAVTGWLPLGLITPVGGVALLGGWLMLARAALRL